VAAPFVWFDLRTPARDAAAAVLRQPPELADRGRRRDRERRRLLGCRSRRPVPGCGPMAAVHPGRRPLMRRPAARWIWEPRIVQEEKTRRGRPGSSRRSPTRLGARVALWEPPRGLRYRGLAMSSPRSHERPGQRRQGRRRAGVPHPDGPASSASFVATAHGSSGTRTNAEDALQETLVKAWSNLGTFAAVAKALARAGLYKPSRPTRA